MLKLLKVAFVLLAAMTVAACGTSRPSLTPAEVAGSGASQAPDYRIGPGDSLQIFVWDQPDLNTGVQVRPDGRISTPLVEDLQAAGRTPTQLARDIETVLADFVRSPVVTVLVSGFVGDVDQQIRVVGQAVAPQALQYREGMSLLDVMIQVGGLSEFAAGNRSRVIRQMNGEQVEIRVRIDDLLSDGDLEQDLQMLPGDVLVIPESAF